jgi:Sigma-70 region 2
MSNGLKRSREWQSILDSRVKIDPISSASVKTIDPDAALMVRFRQGDRTAFETLFEKYHRPILNFSYRFLENRDDAEEVVQETFLQVFDV